MKILSLKMLKYCIFLTVVLLAYRTGYANAEVLSTSSVSKIDNMLFTSSGSSYNVAGDRVHFSPKAITIQILSENSVVKLNRLKRDFKILEKVKAERFMLSAISDLGIRSSQNTYQVDSVGAQIGFSANTIRLETSKELHQKAISILERDGAIYLSLIGKNKFTEGYWSLSFGLERDESVGFADRPILRRLEYSLGNKSGIGLIGYTKSELSRQMDKRLSPILFEGEVCNVISSDFSRRWSAFCPSGLNGVGIFTGVDSAGVVTGEGSFDGQNFVFKHSECNDESICRQMKQTLLAGDFDAKLNDEVPNQLSITERLEEARALFDQGLISEDEYSKVKKNILGL